MGQARQTSIVNILTYVHKVRTTQRKRGTGALLTSYASPLANFSPSEALLSMSFSKIALD